MREKGKDTQVNVEYLRRARRDKKALLSEQYKEIKERKRKGKNREFFKKIRDTKRTFHVKMGTMVF